MMVKIIPIRVRLSREVISVVGRPLEVSNHVNRALNHRDSIYPPSSYRWALYDGMVLAVWEHDYLFLHLGEKVPHATYNRLSEEKIMMVGQLVEFMCERYNANISVTASVCRPHVSSGSQIITLSAHYGPDGGYWTEILLHNLEYLRLVGSAEEAIRELSYFFLDVVYGERNQAWFEAQCRSYFGITPLYQVKWGRMR